MLDQFIGQVLADKYRIDSVLRETDSGKIYHGTHLLMDKPVAVKILSPALAADAKAVERFSAEAQNLSHISHPNILSVTDFGREPEGAVYIVYEDAEGETLKNAIRREGMFEAERAVNIARQTAAALAAAHIKGLVHGNLNSENILLIHAHNGLETVKILDLGAVKAESGDGVPADEQISPAKIEYFAPEQCADLADTNECSDIYALGIVLYEMLAGEVPFRAENLSDLRLKHAQEPPPPLSAFRHDLPANLELIVLQALAKNPEMRYQTAAELIDDLNRVSLNLIEQETVAGAKAAPAAGNNIWKTAFIVLAGISILAIGLIYATSVKQTNPPTLPTDANGQPVQPINPATGLNEQSLANIVPMQPGLSNSNVMVVPNTLPGGDGYNPWASGNPPPGAPPVYIPPGGQVITIGNSNSPFMQDGVIYVPVPANTNVNAQPTPVRTPRGNTANTNAQTTPAPNETPKTQATPETRPSPAKTAAPTPRSTERPKTNQPSSTGPTESEKQQDIQK
jgi:hypothetical protein